MFSPLNYKRLGYGCLILASYWASQLFKVLCEKWSIRDDPTVRITGITRLDGQEVYLSEQRILTLLVIGVVCFGCLATVCFWKSHLRASAIEGKTPSQQ
jgi:hypothetical protein